MRIIGIRNRHVPQLPRRHRKRRWYALGDCIRLSPSRVLEIGSEPVAGGPRALVLLLHTEGGTHVVRTPEDLSFYTVDALVRAVEHDAGGAVRALIDTGELVTAPALLGALR